MKRIFLIFSVTLLFALKVFAEGVNELPVNWQGLPEPYHTRSVSNPGRVIDKPENAKLTLPAGFTIEEFMSGFRRPRYMIAGENSEIILSDIGAGVIYAIRDKQKHELIKNMFKPYGLAFYKEWLYVADERAIWRFPYDGIELKVGEREKIFSLKEYASGHITRTILFDYENDKLYLSVGSRSNVSSGEPQIRAAVSRMNPDGSGLEIFASGIRNGVGMDWNPVSKKLWVTSHERDGLGDELVPDYLTEVEEGGFYGWPYAYIGPHEDPRHKDVAPEMVKKTRYPSVLLGSHVGALDVMFYEGGKFPKNYQNGAFVAHHGSWNRSKLAGYEVVFIPFNEEGKATSGPQPFISGWKISEDSNRVWGRPVALVEMDDGSILLSDDGAGKIWRIDYTAAEAE